MREEVLTPNTLNAKIDILIIVLKTNESLVYLIRIRLKAILNIPTRKSQSLLFSLDLYCDNSPFAYLFDLIFNYN
jgi:hypothetical protein